MSINVHFSHTLYPHVEASLWFPEHLVIVDPNSIKVVGLCNSDTVFSVRYELNY